MAYREVTMLEITEVLRLWLSGTPKKGIGNQLGLDVKTVRRYVRAAEGCGLRRDHGPDALTAERLGEIARTLQPRGGRPRGDGWTLCEQHREFIRKHLRSRVRLTKIRKLLRRQGVLVSYPTLRRFAISELGFSSRSLTIPVADCQPGEELQLDTGWVGYLSPNLLGQRRRFRAWIFTAVLSRYRFVFPVFKETTQTAIEACEAAWQFFGGIFRALIVDNTKAIVHTADPLGARLIAAFLEYSQARGFVVDTTRVRSPRDKARVERAVATVRDDCFAGENLQDLDAARELARTWCLEEYGMRRHSTTLRMPREYFEAEELTALAPPPDDVYDIPLWTEPKVHRDQHAQVAKALYSLPQHFVGKTLTARADSHTVRFYERGVLVKTHPRQPPGKRSSDRSDFPDHKAAYALRDVQFLIRQAEAHGPAIGAFARALLDTELPWTRMRQAYALLSLVRRYGAQRVEHACHAAVEVEMFDVRKLTRLIELARSHPETASAQQLAPVARFLRPADQYALPMNPSRPSHTKGDKS